MPKQEIDADALYNLALSIVGLVLGSSGVSVAQLADHFDVSEKVIVKAVKTIANSEDLARFETHFYVDEEALEDGEVSFGLGQGNLESAPSLSGLQLSALAMGLEFLASLPEFEGNADLTELRNHLGQPATMPVTARLAAPLDFVDSIRKAIVENFSIEFEYTNQVGRQSVRRVDPLRIDLIGTRHYLRGFCFTAGELRSFRIDRIRNFKSLPDEIQQSSREIEVPEAIFGEGMGQAVLIEADSTAAEIFWNFPSMELQSMPEGKRRGVISVGSIAGLARHVVRYGGAVRIIKPHQAREAVANFAREALMAATVEGE
jgi:proteasome accessory factor C